MSSWLFGKPPIKIYPVFTDPTHGKSYFLDFCVGCGGIHTYTKYPGWQIRNHYAQCNMKLRKDLAEKEWLERQTNF